MKTKIQIDNAKQPTNKVNRMAVKLASDSDKSDGAVELLVYDYIGEPGTTSSGAGMEEALATSKGKPVVVKINSRGGLAYDGISMYNALAAHDGHVTTRIMGEAASAATIVAVAGDKVEIVENGSFMVHRALTIAIGNTADMLDVAEYLDGVDKQIAATFAAKTGKSVEEVMAYMVGKVDGTTFSAAEALEAGFVDAILPLKKNSKGKSADNKAGAVTNTQEKNDADADAEKQAAEKQAQADADAEAVRVRMRVMELDEVA